MTTFGNKLKQARIEAALKQSELANIIGTTNTTISNWEKGVSKPDLDTLALICGVLKKSPSYFLESKLPDDDITYQEFELIKKYRELDAHGKEMVDMVLLKEHDRCISSINRIPRLQPYILADAAHSRTDIDIEEGTDTNEDKIMDEKDF